MGPRCCAVEIFERAGVDPVATNVDIVVKGSGGLGSLFGILITFLPLIFFGAVLVFMMRQAQGSSSQTFSFGKSKAKMFVGNSPSVSFDDVAGVDEAKESRPARRPPRSWGISLRPIEQPTRRAASSACGCCDPRVTSREPNVCCAA